MFSRLQIYLVYLNLETSTLSKQHAPFLICCMNVFRIKQILQLIAVSLRSLGLSAMFYLAAAVSDFYVPWESMVIISFILHCFG